jgi:MoxR-like ATPase
MKDWRIFRAGAPPEWKGVRPHDGLTSLPAPPPWRRTTTTALPEKPARPPFDDFEAEALKGAPIRLKDDPKDKDNVVRAINAALYLRRPLLVTGKPGVGKSSLAYAVAYQLQMGPVLKWPITSRATVKSGLYEYDAVGRLQDADKKELGSYFRLGPLGTALYPTTWPRVLLIDEIDKGDLDLPNDLLNVLEDGYFDIPELARAKDQRVRVKVHGPVKRDGSSPDVEITGGHVQSDQFPFIVMTSNGEREFPAPFLRRCIRATVPQPLLPELKEIVSAHLRTHLQNVPPESVESMITKFIEQRDRQDIATDQLLNAAYLVLGDGRSSGERPDSAEANESLETFKLLLKQLTTTDAT